MGLQLHDKSAINRFGRVFMMQIELLKDFIDLILQVYF